MMFADRTRWNLEQNRLSRRLAETRQSGAVTFDLTRSNPTECGFSYDDKSIQRAFSQSEMLRYVPDPRGMRSAREAVCTYYQKRSSLVTPDDVLLTSGTSEAYSFIFRLLCNPGDQILIPSPGYPLFEFLADLCDVELVRYPLLYDHGWQIDFSALAAAASQRTRGLIVVHPNNPTGHYSSAAEQSALTRFCSQRNIALIADEVFLDFSLAKNPVKSFTCGNNILSFTLSGLSKICGMPQMKLAWVAVTGPAEQKREALARLEVVADAYLSVGTPVQLAAPGLLATSSGFHSQVMIRIHNNLRELDTQLAGQTACNRLRCEGGWSAVLRVPATGPDEDLAISLLSQKAVYLHPGHFYDFSQPGYMVASLMVAENDFAEGIRRTLAHFE
jgi:aspartate/methionine/tyrosine aminotransferase